MATLRIDVETWNGEGDFIMWQKSMKALLMRMKCLKAIVGSWPEGTSNEKQEEADEIAYGEIWLHLTPTVARPYSEIQGAKNLWKALEDDYLHATEPDEMALKGNLYGFKLIQGMSLEANIDKFNKIIQQLASCGTDVEDKDQTVILLNSLPEEMNYLKKMINLNKEKMTKKRLFEYLKEN